MMFWRETEIDIERHRHIQRERQTDTETQREKRKLMRVLWEYLNSVVLDFSYMNQWIACFLS